MKNPRFLMTSINIVSFVNKGKYRKPGKDQLSPEELQSIEKIDITDSIDVLTESYNIYITINKRPHFAIRAKSTIIKAELLKDRYNSYGDPIFNITINTAISYAIANNEVNK